MNKLIETVLETAKELHLDRVTIKEIKSLQPKTAKPLASRQTEKTRLRDN